MKGPQQNSAVRKRHRVLFLLILLFMILGIAQVMLMMNSATLNEVSMHETVDPDVAAIESMKDANEELKSIIQSIEETEQEPEISEVVEPDAQENTTRTDNIEKPAVIDDTEAAVVAVPVVIEAAPEKPAASISDKPVAVKHEEQTVKQQAITKEPSSESLTLLTLESAEADTSPVEDDMSASIEHLSGYIKHDDDGNMLSDDTEQWTCVHDLSTGLMWEVKSEDDGMRRSQNLYSWYDPEHLSEPGKADGGRCAGESDCDTNAYIQAMNEQNYCGHNDWRLPTREQMQTLVDLKRSKADVAIDTQYFPYAVPSWYWTSTDERDKEEFAWYVLFRNGFALSDLKERPKHIRLVRDAASDREPGNDI